MSETHVIIIGVAYVLLMLPLFFAKIYSSKMKKHFSRTYNYIKNVIGWIIGINGPIRVGKTSLQSGLSSVCQMNIMERIDELIQKTKKIFKNIDFNVFDQEIAELLIKYQLKTGHPDIDKVALIQLEKYKLNGDSLHFNMIGNIEIRKMIIDYIFAFYCIFFRNNYVQSKTPIYSNVTHTFNLELNVDWLSIRKAYKNKDYSILDWMVLLIDESTDEVGAMKYLQDVQDESGAKEYRRKFGQIHQERNWIITTKQDIMDEVKKYRNLTHTNLVLDQSVYTIGNYKVIYKIIEFLYYTPVFLFTLFVILPKVFKQQLRRLFRKEYLTYQEIYDFHHNKVGIIRKQENKLYYHKNFFSSIGLNVYTGYILDRAEDYERSTADRDYIQIRIPTYLCWGTYNTHLYAVMQEDLLNNSQSISEVVNPFTRKDFFDQEDNKKSIENGDDGIEF